VITDADGIEGKPPLFKSRAIAVALTMVDRAQINPEMKKPAE
jgi:hypothetical protein